jgi:hypothetical protein
MVPSPFVDDEVVTIGARDVSGGLKDINSVPLAGQIISVILAVCSVAIISSFLSTYHSPVS